MTDRGPFFEPPKVHKRKVIEDTGAVDFLDLAEQRDPFNPVNLRESWMDEKEFILGTPENLAEIIDRCIESGRYALDLETTGLDNRIKKSVNGHYETVDRIAGVCLSPDGVKGYYIPLHHYLIEESTGARIERECNIPIDLFDREFRRLIDATEKEKTVAVFHNGKFDQEFLQFNETGTPWGEWDRHQTWEDTMIAAYMRNTRARRKGLKALSEAPTDATSDHTAGGPGLGMKMLEIHLLWRHKKMQRGFNYDFSELDPTQKLPLWYACSDAICTWLLWDMLAPVVMDPDTDGKSQITIYRIEKICIAATRWMERNRIYIDRSKVMGLVSLGQQEWFDSILEVYQEATKVLGRDVKPEVYKEVERHFVANNPRNLLHQQIENARIATKRIPPPPDSTKNGKTWPAVYDVNSQQQLGKMFDEIQVPGLRHTEKSGQVKTSKDELNRILEETGDRFPFMAKVKRFREVAKALSTYLEPMLLDSDSDDSMRINFNGTKVDTGRFSTPAKESSTADRQKGRMVGWPQLNIQSTPSTYDPKRPQCMNRLRECFAARPPTRYWLNGESHPIEDGVPLPEGAIPIPKFYTAIDYAGVELRLATNLSREPKWLNEFFHCSSCDRTFEQTPRESIDPPTVTPLPPPARCPNCGSDKIGDLHTLTGLEIFGADAINRPDWKAIRDKAKATNFALSYGGGGSAVCRAASVDRNEGARIKVQFDSTYFGLKRWWLSQYRYAKTYGFVRTAMNRKYPVPDIHSSEGGFRAKAERNSVNGPIQGCVVGDARIWTDDGAITLAEASEIHGNDHTKVWTGREWSPARVLFSGNKDLVWTTLKSGKRIGTSPDHRFCVWSGSCLEWKRQEDLVVGDWVAESAMPIDRKAPVYRYSVPSGQRWHIPPSLVEQVGTIVYHSSIYPKLPRNQKSVVLRMKKGAASKPQCLKYIALVDSDDARKLLDVLTYNFDPVVSFDVTGTQVPMYDVEVFDDRHAFACDGVIVHNSSADITKTAMAFVYKFCKSKGWLDRVQMIITMHDELVFEIDADIIEEVIPVIVDLMTSNAYVLAMNWPIPLTMDVEMGHDWTVPWDLNSIRHGEVRFDGDKKVKKPKEPNPSNEGYKNDPVKFQKDQADFPKRLADWETLPRWPASLKPWFKEAQGKASPALPSLPDSSSPAHKEKGPPQSPSQPASSADPIQISGIDTGTEYTYQLSAPLQHRTAVGLAKVIHQCAGGGSRVLHIRSSSGIEIKGWNEGAEIKVNPVQFETLVEYVLKQG